MVGEGGSKKTLSRSKNNKFFFIKKKNKKIQSPIEKRVYPKFPPPLPEIPQYFNHKKIMIKLHLKIKFLSLLHNLPHILTRMFAHKFLNLPIIYYIFCFLI